MKKTDLSSLASIAENFSKIIGLVAKLSVALGGICVAAYAVRIGYFPSGVFVGDSILLLLAATIYGAVYVFFLGSMLSLGMCLSFAAKWAVRVVQKLSGDAERQVYKFARFHWVAAPFALFALLFIFFLGEKDGWFYFNLPLCSIALYLFYSTLIDSYAHYRRGRRVVSTSIAIPEEDLSVHSAETGKHWNVVRVSGAIVLLLPMLISGATGYLLDGAMRLVKVRVERPVVYVKAPYGTMLPNELTIHNEKTPEGYVAYKGTTVLFKGFGSMTVVSFPDNGHTRQLEIPKESIIVEPTDER